MLRTLNRFSSTTLTIAATSRFFFFSFALRLPLCRILSISFISILIWVHKSWFFVFFDILGGHWRATLYVPTVYLPPSHRFFLFIKAPTDSCSYRAHLRFAIAPRPSSSIQSISVKRCLSFSVFLSLSLSNDSLVLCLVDLLLTFAHFSITLVQLTSLSYSH